MTYYINSQSTIIVHNPDLRRHKGLFVNQKSGDCNLEENQKLHSTKAEETENYQIDL